MSPSETVAEFIKAIETRDMMAAKHFLADDVRYEVAALTGPGHRTVGAEAVANRLQGALDGCERTEWEIRAQIEQGEIVFNDRIDRFWFPRGMFPGGTLSEWPTAGHFQVRGGKITFWRDFGDTQQPLQQLGVDMAEFGRRLGRRYG